jgi:hypothetical protein
MHQLQDPRVGFAEDSNMSSSIKTQQIQRRRRNTPRQASPPITAEYEES